MMPGSRPGREVAAPTSGLPSHPLGARLLEHLQSIVGGVLIDIGDRREVEDILDKDLDRATELHAHLTDVDKLRRALADDVNAEEPERLAIEEQLEQARRIAQDLRPRVLPKMRPADEIRHGLRLQRIFRLADHRDLGDRVEAIRDKRRNLLLVLESER